MIHHNFNWWWYIMAHMSFTHQGLLCNYVMCFVLMSCAVWWCHVLCDDVICFMMMSCALWWCHTFRIDVSCFVIWCYCCIGQHLTYSVTFIICRTSTFSNTLPTFKPLLILGVSRVFCLLHWKTIYLPKESIFEHTGAVVMFIELIINLICRLMFYLYSGKGSFLIKVCL
jgi:hypothetical protein